MLARRRVALIDDIEHFMRHKAMSAEQMKTTQCCQSGIPIWRQCAVALAIMFVSATVGGAIGGGTGAAMYGPFPADWGVAASIGFAAGAGTSSLITMAPLFRERH